MNVNTAETRDFQHGLRQNLAIGDDNDEVGLGGPQGIDGGGLANFQRLLDGKTKTLRRDFHRRRAGLEVATFRAVRLGYNRDNFMAGYFRHGLKTRCGKFRCSHENNTHVESALTEPPKKFKRPAS